MARRGDLKTPEEKALAVARASKIYSRARAKIAFFFVGGRLLGCQSDKPEFEKRVSMYSSSLIGVYELNLDFRLIIDDIDAYYEQFGIRIPEFNSIGGRQA